MKFILNRVHNGNIQFCRTIDRPQSHIVTIQWYNNVCAQFRLVICLNMNRQFQIDQHKIQNALH